MKKRKKFILISVACCVVGLILGVSFIVGSIVSYSSVDERQHCDAVIVLGAASYNGEPSPVFRERLNHGVYLVENGFADTIILTGGIGKGATESDAAVGKRYVVSLGIPENAVLIEERSRITEENLMYAKGLMDGHNLETAILVSDPLHMKRAMLMAEDFGIEAYSSPTPSTMYKSMRTKLPFLARETFFYIGYCILRPFR